MASGQARLRSGYINNLKSHDIEPDPIKSKIIAKAFAEYATGKHSLESLRQRLSFWGVVNRYGKSLSISTVQRMLTCKAYIGVIERAGESYTGGFPSIVSIATFEKVQQVLKDKFNPRYKRQKHNSDYLDVANVAQTSRHSTPKATADGMYTTDVRKREVSVHKVI